jgi:hypothetical protein
MFEWTELKFGSRVKYGTEQELQEKMFATRKVSGIDWVIKYIKYNNAMGIRTLALIHGGSNDN